MAGDELVDVVDEHDRVVRVVPRSEMRAHALWHRAVYLLVLDTTGRVLVQQRSYDKDFAPGWWDIGAGGVVGAGESYVEAGRRELAEELGVTGVPLQLLGTTRFEHPELRLHGRAYRVVHDGPFHFDDGEVLQTAWATVDELRVMLTERRFVPDSPAIFLPYLDGSRTRTQ